MSLLDSKGIPLNDSILMQTRKKRDIANRQTGRIDWGEMQYFLEKLKGRHKDAIFRTDPITAYNCHGLTFASRRTWIELETEIEKIIEDDMLSEIDALDALPGDIVIYRNNEDNSIAHSGLLISDGKSTYGNPQVLSKWARFAEVIHKARYGPYAEFVPHFYRIKE